MSTTTLPPHVSAPPRRSAVLFQCEPWDTYAEDARHLWPLHWKEVGLDHDAVPMDMDVDRYAALEAGGMLHLVTGRHEGRLVAYFTGIVIGHLHYKGTVHCFTDLYYIHPLWRKGMTALRLFGHVHRTLKERGVVKIITGTKLHDGLDMSRLFEYMKYRYTEKTYTKLL